MESFNQDKSIADLKRNVLKEFDDYFPYERNDYRFEVNNIKIEEPSMTHDSQQQAFLNDENMEAKVRGDVEVYYKDELVKKHKNQILTRIPFPTERGTYVVGGNESVVLNRMQMRNGIYVHPNRKKDKKDLLTAEVRSGKQRFTVNLRPTVGKITVNNLSMQFGKTPKTVDFVSLLHTLDVSDSEIKSAMKNESLYNTVMENSGKQSTEQVYQAMFSGDYPGADESKEKIKAYLTDNLTFSEDSQKLNKQTIGKAAANFDADSMLQTLGQLSKEYQEPGSSVKPDDFRFKVVIPPEKTVQEYTEKGIKDWINHRLRNITYSGMTEKKKAGLNAKPEQFVHNSMKKMYNSDLSEHVDSSNPLDAHQKLYKVSSLGTGGLTTRSAKEENRNLQDTAFAKIDPVETSQSGRMGLVQHFASGAETKNGRLYSKFYRVKNGKIDYSKQIDDIDPLDEFEEYIAFNNPSKMVKNDNGKPIRFKNNQVKVRHKGDFVDVPVDQVTLIDATPTSHLSHSTSLIPYGAHNDGARMLMGSSMGKQSMSLDDPDEPVVQSLSDADTGKTVEEEMAERSSSILKSPVSGTVKKITDETIQIEKEDGETEDVKKLNYFTTGKAGGYINHKPVVKPGNKVKKGELLADGWQSKNGRLALGKNTRVAYMPYKGYNFEDGVVASDSFAKKMASEEVKTIEVEFNAEDGDVIFGDSEVKKILKDLHVSPGILSKLDADGVIKKGSEIVNGDIFVGAVRRKEKEDLSKGQRDVKRMMRNKIFEIPSDHYQDISRKATGYQSGKVINVDKNISGDTMRVSIKLLNFKSMEIGDKLAGRHGNKGTITKVVPDDEMPHTEDKKPVELIFSPLAVPSRKNVGQLMEVNAGLVAEKKGLDRYKVQNFDPDESKRLQKELKEIGIPDGKQTLINPETGEAYENKVTVGPMHMMKLKHKVENKINARNIKGSIDELNQRPRKTSGQVDGDRHNPQSIGGMEFWSLTSAGANENVHEMTTYKSDGAGDRKQRKDIFNAIRRGMPIPEPATPQTVKNLKEQLLSAGVNMTALRDDKEVSMDEKFTNLMLNPLKDDEIKSLAPKEVTNSKSIDARKKTFEKDGIYDPEIFGEDGSQWGRIDLVNPMPNPLFLDNKNGPRPYESMLTSRGMKQKEIDSIINGKTFVVTDPKDTTYQQGDMISLKELDDLELEETKIGTMTGGAAIAHVLKDVDMKEELNKSETRLSQSKNASQRSKAEKHVRVLSNALDKGYKPEDFLMKSVPVLPTKYRKPLKMQNSDTFSESDISILYENLVKQNNDAKKFIKEKEDSGENIDGDIRGKNQKEFYESLAQVIGTKKAADAKRGHEYKGIMESIKSKEGFLRSKMQSKLQDYSGRSVIVVDPTLNLDETTLPEDLAGEVFEPKVRKELERQRYNSKTIKEIMEKKDQRYRDALERVSKDHPVILNRQPSLHRHSMQSFRPKISWNKDGERSRAIGLNPVVTTGYNADFDGDQMAVHLPISQAAIKEAEDKLLPSKNLLNPTNNDVITDLKHEMQLGIYYMTRDKPTEGTATRFKSVKELEAAYKQGKVKTHAPVVLNVPGKGDVRATAGQHLFNMNLPKGFQDYKKNIDVNKKKMKNILMDIINDEQKGGTQKAVETINRLQTVGFESATTSGMSIGISDFDDIQNKDTDAMFTEAEKKLKEENPSLVMSGMIDGRDAMEQEKSKAVSAELTDWIDNNVDPDNPIGTMMSSGARGDAGQINAMAGIIGVGKDVESKATRPINTSFLDGLSSDEFWDLSADSRKGILDKSIATAEPGALTREVWMSNKQTVITEKDCGDRTGIWLDMNKDKDKRKLSGHVLLADVELKQGGVVRKTGRPISKPDRDKVMSRAKEKVNIRSILTCKTNGGVCQLCYGAGPGSTDNKLVGIGTPVGSIAAQALGEPSTQAILKAFHVGAAQSSASGAFDRIQESLRAPEHFNEPDLEAVMVKADGEITDVKNDPIKGTIVKVDSKKYNLGKKQIAPNIEVGSTIKQGDMLTKEFDDNNNRMVIRNPRDVLEYQGLDVAKDYISDGLDEAYSNGGITDTDTRHYDLVTRNMLGETEITDPGTSPFQKGQRVSRDTLNRYNDQTGRVQTVEMNYYNKQNVVGAIAAQDYSNPRRPAKVVAKKGEAITAEDWEELKERRYIKVKSKPVQHEPRIKGVNTANLTDGNWMDAAAFKDATRIISEGTMMGMSDKLDNPLTRQMTGLMGNFGTGLQNFADGVKDKFTNGFF